MVSVSSLFFYNAFRNIFLRNTVQSYIRLTTQQKCFEINLSYLKVFR